MTKQPTIALNMIVRNEAASLPRCLTSVQPFVDEIVVVDTGSTDNTVEIARAFGANIFHFTWIDDFAAARNFALDQTRSDWVLYLDADEDLVLDSPDALRRLISAPTPRPRCYLVKKVNLNDRQPDGLGDIFFESRLFKRASKVRFARPIHEQVVHVDGIDQIEYRQADGLSIRHYGYVSALREQKSKRDLPIIEAAVRANPDDPDNHFFLGREHYRSGRYEHAIGPLERAIRLIDEQQTGRPYLHVAYALLSAALLLLRRFPEALRVARAGLARSPHPELWLNLGFALEGLGRLDEASQCYEEALKGAPANTLILGSPGASTWMPLKALGSVYERLGDRARAHEYYCRVLEHLPNDEAIRAKVELTRPKPSSERTIDLPIDDGGSALERQLLEALGERPENLETRLQLAGLLARRGRHDQALELLAEAVEGEPKSPELYRLLGSVLQSLGRYEDAANALEIALRLKRATPARSS